MNKEAKMEKGVSIQSIKILMGKKEVELSIEEAKKLKSALEEIFGKTVIEKTETIHHHDYYRYYDWNRYFQPSPKVYPMWGQVYCQAGNTNLNTSENKMMNTTLCLDIK